MMSVHPLTPIRIIQHNCARSTNVMQSCLNSATNTADLVLLQEPWIMRETGTTISHPSFQSIIPRPTAGQRPRVAAFVSRTNIHLRCALRMDISDDPDILALDIHSPGIPTTTVLCVYNERSQEEGDQQYTVERALTRIELPARAIICGDFNSHYGWWDSATSNVLRAEGLIRWLAQYECELINTPDVPTHNYRNGRGASVINLAFATPMVYHAIQDWAVDDEHPTGSDHELIRFNIQVDQNVDNMAEHPISWPYNYKKADWEVFTRCLCESAERTRGHVEQLIRSGTEHSQELLACLLRDLILDANRGSIPFRKPSPQSKVWWSDEITMNRREMAIARRTWKATRTDADWTNVK